MARFERALSVPKTDMLPFNITPVDAGARATRCEVDERQIQLALVNLGGGAPVTVDSISATLYAHDGP